MNSIPGRRRYACLLTAATALVGHPLVAQESDGAIQLAPITVNSDRKGSEVLDVPANISVITEDEIENRNVTDMEELVRTTPGVTVGRQTTSTDPFNTFGGFNIRGVGGNRVQIQVDGSRVPERITDGTRDYLDFNFTKQVEIVRGPASVLWGSDALGGLVAVETLDPEDVLQGRDRATRMRLGYDSFNNGTLGSFTFGQKLSPTVDVMIGIARENANEAELSNARADGGAYGCPRNTNVGATDCGSLDPTDIASNRLLGKLVWTPNAQHRLEFSADILDRETDVQYNNTLGPVISMTTGAATGEVINKYDRTLDTQRKRYAIEHTWTPMGGFLDQLQTTFAYTPNGYQRNGVENSVSAAGDSVVTYDTLNYSEDFIELDIQANSSFQTGNASHQLVYGFDGDQTDAEYFRRDIVDNLTQGTTTETRAGGFNFADSTTRRADIYIEDRITFGGGQFELTPGLRFATYKITPYPNADYQVVAGSEPRVRQDEQLLKSLGAIYRLNDTYSIWAKYGEGFKMPTAQQLYTSLPGNFFNLTPAPGLEPEEVESIELGFRGVYDRGFFAVNAFQADYNNFIQSFYNPPGTSDYTYRNISAVKVWGIEASAAWEFSDLLTGTVAASWQKGTQQVDPSAAETPHTLPPLMATVSLEREFPQANLTVEAVGTFAAAVKETESAADFKPAGYGLLDLHARWQVTRASSINFSISNVFDKRYFTPNAANYGSTASTSVASANPIELQTGPGRTFQVAFEMTF